MSHDFSTHNVAFKTPWVVIYERDTWYALASPTGLNGGGALIMDSQGQVLLVRIYRHPINRIVLEIPRGAADPDDPDGSIGTAIREASEETGVDLSGARVIDLGIIYPDDGILAFETRICAAILPHPFGTIRIEEAEVLGFQIVSFDALKDMILNGEVNDSHTIVATFRLDAVLRKAGTEAP